MSALKPVQLQINNSGAWNAVVRFDAGDESAWAKVQQAVEILGDIDSGGTTKWRIATDEPYPAVLMEWTARNGWRSWRQPHADQA